MWVRVHAEHAVKMCVCVCLWAPVWVAGWLQDARSWLCWNAPWQGLLACCAPGNSWHFFICAPNCWFTLLLMACEVGSRRRNGRGNLARGVQMVHYPSLSLPSSLSFSVYSTLLWLADIFSASFIYALFHQYGVLLAKCLVKLSLKIRDDFISLSLTCFFFFLPFFFSAVFPSFQSLHGMTCAVPACWG